MSSEYLTKQADKLLTAEGQELPFNQAMLAAFILANYKGENLKIFNASKTSSLCDYHILASAQNPTQGRSMIDELARQLRAHEMRVHSVEGYTSADWILLDTGDVIVHVFQDSSRDIFDLDSVLATHPQLEIPEEFYFSRPTTKEEDRDLKGYF